MRLIDADVVKQNILEVIKKQGGKSKDLIPVRELPLFIDIQPTVYSVGKVVEELEKELSLADKEKERCTGENHLQFDSVKGYASGISTAIEIVKQGGVAVANDATTKNDDVCEWKSASAGEFIQNPHTKRLFSNEQSMQNVYCNTCGNKIKLVE